MSPRHEKTEGRPGPAPAAAPRRQNCHCVEWADDFRFRQRVPDTGRSALPGGGTACQRFSANQAYIRANCSGAIAEAAGATNGFAEDYAFLIQGLLDLYEADFDLRWLRWAGELQVQMNALFADPEGRLFQHRRGRGRSLVPDEGRSRRSGAICEFSCGDEPGQVGQRFLAEKNSSMRRRAFLERFTRP